MRFAHFTHVWNKPGMTPAQRYRQLWRELAACDELGFDYSFCVEHHFSPQESWMPSPSIYCAAAATHTRRLRVGPMGYIVPLYNPLRIVEDAAVLDQLLDGRLELGLISGISPHYFRPYQADFARRRERVSEALALVKTAFASDGPFSFSGPFHRYEQVSLAVRPVQRPHPPLWVQSRDPDTLALLAREGVSTGYLFLVPRAEAAPRYRDYLRAWRAAGHAQPPNIAYWSLVYVAETDEQALAEAAPHIVYTFTQVFGFGDVGGIAIAELAANLERRGEHGAAEIARHLADVDYLLRRNLVFVGSPETVARGIQRAAAEGLFNTLCAEFNIGSLDEERLMRSLHLFAQRVIPALRAYSPY
jgi:alkanesulfonate monooxygenase SsuD/methylene tetrahydromethanopterin reductase-like flavin-dependent oxidoreductase (luciferase family)